MRTLIILLVLSLCAAFMIACYAALVISSAAQEWEDEDEPTAAPGDGEEEGDGTEVL